MVTSLAKYTKIAQLIKKPFDPVTAKIIGGAGGLALGLGLAGSVVAHGNLSLPAVVAVFIGFSIVCTLVGLGIINYAARNSASLSTIIFAMAGADFAGAFGAIAATACVSVTNTVIYAVAGMTIDDMLADGLVASVRGVDQIIKDSQEAIASMPAKTKTTSHSHAQTREVSVSQVSIPAPQQAVVAAQTQVQVATKAQKPRKSFVTKLSESREETKSAKPKKKSKDTFAQQLEEAREVAEDKRITR